MPDPSTAFNEIVTNITNRLRALETIERPGSAIIVAGPAPAPTAAENDARVQEAMDEHPGSIIMLRAGLYRFQHLNITAGLMGRPNYQTTVKWADQNQGPSATMMDLTTSGIIMEDLIVDGNRSTVLPGSSAYWTGLLTFGRGVSDCRFSRVRVQNTARGAYYGKAEDQARTVGTASISSGSNVVVAPGIGFLSPSDVGRIVGIAGANPANEDNYALITTIASITDANTAVLNAPAGRTVSNAVIYVGLTNNTPISRNVWEDCEWDNIGFSGADRAGAGVFFEQNARDNLWIRCRSRRLSSNWLKITGNVVACPNNQAVFNTIDYSGQPTYETTYGALAMEFWYGASYTTCFGNKIIGPPDTAPDDSLFGISFGYAPNSVCVGNSIRKGGTSNTKIVFGIETADCPRMTRGLNSIAGCRYGANFTNNDPVASHSMEVVGEMFQDIYENAIITDSSPGAIKISACSFEDCGIAYIFFNAFNASGGDGTIKSAIVEGCTFCIKKQTRQHGEGEIYGIYAYSTANNILGDLQVNGCSFAPHPEGTSNVPMVPIEVNNMSGVRVTGGIWNGRSPDNTVSASYGIKAYAGNIRVRGVTGRNFATAFAFVYPGSPLPASSFELNDVGTLDVLSNGNSPTTVLYLDPADNHLKFKRHTGVVVDLTP